MEKKEQQYYVGLDMGTSSIGWAVTDFSYHLMRRKGKDMWGVRLFPEAVTAAERRQHRVDRRRKQRRKARIGMLKELLQPEIDKVDPNFYQRLDESKFHKDDKSEGQTYALFNDKNYTDQDYYAQYPTIFHLRKELMDSKEPHDVRLVYLAILNIFKHRGHFLNAGLGDSGMDDFHALTESFHTNYEEFAETEFTGLENLYELENVFLSRDYSPSRKCEIIAGICGISKSKDKQKYEMIKMMCGLKGKLSVMFPQDEMDDEFKKESFSFKNAEIDEYFAKVEPIIGEQAYEVLLDMKRIYDWSVLSNIMSGEGVHYISEARIRLYEKHKEDLRILKELYKRNSPETYDEMFRIMQKGNYSAYVGSVNSDKGKVRRSPDSKNRTDEFMNRLANEIKSMPQDEDTEYILSEMDKDMFLPKQLTGDNGIIPYQLHKAELVRILENASEYIPLLKEKDESGLTVAERITKLFEYNIPYFVGPLRNTQNGTGWSEVIGKGKITPWNIQQRIDFKKSEEDFIIRMIKHCSYLSEEQVLPRESLLYQKYCVLNELNALKINGVKLSVDQKQQVYNDLFKKGKKVKGKEIKSYIKQQGWIENGQEIALSGVDTDFVNTLSSYKKFAEVFKVKQLTYAQEQIAEDIIKWITIHSSSKKMIKDKITEKYGEVLTGEQINRISGYKFTGWGRLSKEFLQTKEKDGELTVIQRMWETNYNLMELLSSDFGYGEAVNEKCSQLSKTLEDMEYEDLNEYYLSSPVKRMVWQTLLILREIVEVMGCEPQKLFIEMTRSEGEKKRTESRKRKLEGLYQACKKEEAELFASLKDETDASLRIKKLYLYYKQRGRCMYTGERISLDELMNDNLYDIDHIYPRHFRKDDSLENNLVLVKKYINNRKQDTYPIEETIRRNMTGWWNMLYKQGFLSKTKYERLVRNTTFSPEEKAEFIQRQLVETSQGTKAVAGLMEQLFADGKVIYVKASTVSQFRQQKDMLKVRVINDLHHAQDAYLNIVVGNVYNVKFTKNPMNFIKEYEKDPEKHKYHLEHMFDYEVRRGSEVAWTMKENPSIDVVRKVMSKGTPLVTHMNFEAHGGITRKDTIYGKGTATKDAYLPISSKDERLQDVTKYGGRMDILGTYFFLVEHTEKGKRVRTIEPMYLYMVDKFKSKEDIEKYCRERLGYEDPSVRLAKIKMYSKLSVNGYEMLLTGRSGISLLVSNAMQLKLEQKYSDYIKRISVALERAYTVEQMERNGIKQEHNTIIYDILMEKHSDGVFNKRPNAIGKKLKVHKNDFGKLSIIKQCSLLLEILKATGKENVGCDLTAIEESKSSGKMTLGKKISGYSSIELINQSITGLYESRVNLLTV